MYSIIFEGIVIWYDPNQQPGRVRDWRPIGVSEAKAATLRATRTSDINRAILKDVYEQECG